MTKVFHIVKTNGSFRRFETYPEALVAADGRANAIKTIYREISEVSDEYFGQSEYKKFKDNRKKVYSREWVLANEPENIAKRVDSITL